MDGESVRIVDDDSGDEPEPWNPARSWWIAAATAFGIALAVAILVINLRAADEPPNNPPEASPAATATTAPPTTTTLPPTAPPTAPPTTTSTIAMGQTIRVLANVIEPDIRAFCERASPLGTDELKEVGEWRESLNDEDFWTLHTLEAVFFEIDEVRATVNAEHRVLLDSVRRNVMSADSALHGAAQAADEGDSDEWMYWVARIERFCSRAMTTIATMVTLSTR